jgi:hypothetical protein
VSSLDLGDPELGALEELLMLVRRGDEEVIDFGVDLLWGLKTRSAKLCGLLGPS